MKDTGKIRFFGIAGAGRVAVFLLAVFSFAGISRAAAPDSLASLLVRTRSILQQFVEDLGNMRYSEDVVQQKLGNNGKITYKQETVFDTLILMHFDNHKLNFEESRLREREPRHPEVRPLMLTSGFSTLAMIFHPFYESSFTFTRLDDDVVDGKTLVRVHYEHVLGTPSPALYQMLYSQKPIELSGTAWLDPDSGQILRIIADVGSTMQDLGIKGLRAEVDYAPVRMSGSPQPLWLPSSATIDLETPKQHWRNIHRFANYRRYTVDVKIEVNLKQP
jgi:hypothetical protein